VIIAAAADYEPLVTSYGLKFAPLVGLIAELMNREMVHGILDTPGNPLRFAWRFFDEVKPLMRKLIADCWEACRGAQCIIASTLGVFAAYDIARHLNVPLCPVHMHPYGPTRAYPHIFFNKLPRWVPLRDRYTRLTHHLADAAFWVLLRGVLSDARSALFGVPRLTLREIYRRTREEHAPVLLAYSPIVAPRAVDLGGNVHLTGYWFLDRPPDWRPPDDLVRFLEAGPPPVYVSFGSMLVGRDPEEISSMVVRALQRSDRRGILSSGWGDLDSASLPEHIMTTGSVPHDWLFPRVSAVVHHGGAGTTASALKAGVPAVVVPFFGDQRLWARRVYELGVGTRPIPRHELTERRLAAAISRASGDAGMRSRAGALGKRLVDESGVERAISVLRRYGSVLG
jgi:UDP:flavonoid glycosyltransferase YjiC (YdhE family)